MHPEPQRSTIGRATVVIAAALFLAVAGFGVAKKSGLVDHDSAKRGVALSLGLMLVVTGNLVPKLRLFESLGRDPIRILTAERVAGWALVIAGLGYAATWALLPTDAAIVWSSLIALPAFVFVSGCMAWSRAGVHDARRANAPRSRRRPALARRSALAAALGSLVFSVAIILIDHLWGDAVSQRLTVWAAVCLPVAISAMLVVRDAKRWLRGHS